MFSTSSEADYALGASLLSFAFLLRNLRISILLQEVQSFKVIMQMIMKMTMPLLYQLSCLYLVFYIFSMIGMYGLSGVIRQPNFHSEDGIPNNLYYLVNFNDLGMSIHTLYAFMIINNWPAITDMMVGASGEVWPRVFFMVFYIIVQWIVLNIVIAIMLELYTNVDGEVEQDFNRLNKVKKLMAMQKKLGDRTFKHYCDEVNEKIMRKEVDKHKLERRASKAQLAKNASRTSSFYGDNDLLNPIN